MRTCHVVSIVKEALDSLNRAQEGLSLSMVCQRRLGATRAGARGR